MELTEIIRRPISTERSNWLRDKRNQYVFEVAKSSTKGQIKEAFTKLFQVDVLKVRTMNMPGKLRRRGGHSGYKPDWKKAIVTVKPGQVIKPSAPAEPAAAAKA